MGQRLAEAAGTGNSNRQRVSEAFEVMKRPD